MSTTSAQATVHDWAEELNAVHTRLAPQFARSQPRQRVRSYLVGLKSSVERKNGGQLAEQAGEPTPTGMQRVFSVAHLWEDLIPLAVPEVRRLLCRLVWHTLPPRSRP